jgi:hypothetical protein
MSMEGWWTRRLSVAPGCVAGRALAEKPIKWDIYPTPGTPFGRAPDEN